MGDSLQSDTIKHKRTRSALPTTATSPKNKDSFFKQEETKQPPKSLDIQKNATSHQRTKSVNQNKSINLALISSQTEEVGVKQKKKEKYPMEITLSLSKSQEFGSKENTKSNTNTLSFTQNNKKKHKRTKSAMITKNSKKKKSEVTQQNAMKLVVTTSQ